MILSSEDQAVKWLRNSRPDVPRETWERLDGFARLLLEESTRQNLVSAATLPNLHLRHVVDSVQLLDVAPARPGYWLDLGSGAGFPGLMVGLFSQNRVTLVESRRLRVEFLQRAAELLGLGERVEVMGAQIERMPARTYDVISARALAPLPRLLPLAHRFSTEKTVWILPKGRSAQTELEQVQDTWQGDFRLMPSLTDPDARIIIAKGVVQRAARSRQGSRT